MKSFKTWCVNTFILGLIFIIFGCFNMVAPTAVNSVIKIWVFISMGFTFIFTSVIFNILANKVNDEMNEMRKRIYNLEHQ